MKLPNIFTWEIWIGLSITIILGLFLKIILNKVSSYIEIPTPRNLNKTQWEDLTTQEPGPGKILGFFERTAFFFSIWIDRPEFIAVWLTFKLASKWQVWQTLTRVPKKLDGFDSNFDYLYARRKWASNIMQRFLIGTICNITFAFTGVLIGENIAGFESIYKVILLVVIWSFIYPMLMFCFYYPKEIKKRICDFIVKKCKKVN